MGCFEPSRLLIKGRLRDKDAFIMVITPGRCTVLTPRPNDPFVPEIQQLAQTLRPFEQLHHRYFTEATKPDKQHTHRNA